jgi:hypothetical protein
MKTFLSRLGFRLRILVSFTEVKFASQPAAFIRVPYRNCSWRIHRSEALLKVKFPKAEVLRSQNSRIHWLINMSRRWFQNTHPNRVTKPNRNKWLSESLAPVEPLDGFPDSVSSSVMSPFTHHLPVLAFWLNFDRIACHNLHFTRCISFASGKGPQVSSDVRISAYSGLSQISHWLPISFLRRDRTNGVWLLVHFCR